MSSLVLFLGAGAATAGSDFGIATGFGGFGTTTGSFGAATGSGVGSGATTRSGGLAGFLLGGRMGRPSAFRRA